MKEFYQPTPSELQNTNNAIEDCISLLQLKEFQGKDIPAKDILRLRLQNLQAGEKVPVVIFNCIDFSYSAKTKSYPEYTVVSETTSSICYFYQDKIADAMSTFEQFGQPELYIIVPDSELFDTRVFPFTQTIDEREQIAQKLENDLSNKLSDLSEIYGAKVILWSNFCKQNDLRSPQEYAQVAYENICNDQKALKAVKEQVKDSTKMFKNNGISEEYLAEIPISEFIERIAWYFSMYAGEGAALVDAKAIVINFEDRRVPGWFKYGAKGLLPIITPINQEEKEAYKSSKNNT